LHKSLVFLVGAAKSRTPMSAIYFSGGYIITERRIVVTHAQRAVKYITYTRRPQSGRTLF